MTAPATIKHAPHRLETTAQPLTVFVCGPKDCEHDYAGKEYIMDSGRVVGWTAICVKCGISAIDAVCNGAGRRLAKWARL